MPIPSIYLDNSTTTKPSEKAVSRMMPFFTTMWGVPSSPHKKGSELLQALTESYRTLYRLLGADENADIIFTSSGAEAVNHVIHAVYKDKTVMTGKNQFLTSAASEAPAIMAIERLETLGCVGKLIPINEHGIITPKALEEAISPRTALLSLPWADGLTGVVQPLEEIQEICKRRGIYLHLEASHVPGKLYYTPGDIQADFISFSGDRFHAPKGTGGLYIKQGPAWSPLISGGSEQGGLRAGHVDMPGLVALACAAQEAIDHCDYMGTEIARLRNKLEAGILKEIPDAVIFFKKQERLPHCTAIAFPGIVNESLLFTLNRKGIYSCIGGGSFQQLSLLLTAAGTDSRTARSAISFSLSRYTSEAEIDTAIAVISETVHRMRNISKEI